jgi:hypothetical protein
MTMRYRVLGDTGIEVSVYCLGASLALDDAALDRIDDIVPPGTNLYQPNLWQPPVLSDAARRRRPPSDRVAA